MNMEKSSVDVIHTMVKKKGIKVLPSPRGGILDKG
jgi:hypothetical protein